MRKPAPLAAPHSALGSGLMWLEERPLLTHRCKLLEHLGGALSNADQVGAVPKPNYIPPLINYHPSGCSGTRTDAHLEGRFYFWGLISSVEGSSWDVEKPAAPPAWAAVGIERVTPSTSQIKTDSQGFLQRGFNFRGPESTGHVFPQIQVS